MQDASALIMARKKINFDKPSAEISRFLAVCSLGRGVRANLKKLFDATNHKSKPGWSGIIEMINTLADEMMPTSGASLSPTDQIRWIRTTLLGYAKTWQQTNPDLSSAMRVLVKEIKPFEAGELAIHLEALLEEGFQLARRCVETCGGERSKSLLASIRAPKLNLILNESGPTYAYCEKDEKGDGTVSLIIGGGRNLLKSYLSLEFYFFHECLSHVLPEWDDLSGRLSEGYLYALEKAFFRGNGHLLKDGFIHHYRVIDEDMEAHREEMGEGRSTFMEDLEGIYVWLDINCQKGVLPRIFLELSAMKPDGEKLQDKLLAMLEMVGNQQNIEAIPILTEHGADPEDLFYHLRALLRGGFPPTGRAKAA